VSEVFSNSAGIAVTKREQNKERGLGPSEVKGLRFAPIHSSAVAPEWTSPKLIHPACKKAIIGLSPKALLSIFLFSDYLAIRGTASPSTPLCFFCLAGARSLPAKQKRVLCLSGTSDKLQVEVFAQNPFHRFSDLSVQSSLKPRYGKAVGYED
jgi:hypothetical protein